MHLCMQYLLDLSPFRKADDDGVEAPFPPFNVKLAAKQLKYFVKDSENLLLANLVCVHLHLTCSSVHQ